MVGVLGLVLVAGRSGAVRLEVARLGAFLLALPLFLDQFLDIPGFSPLALFSQVRISPDAEPYSLYLHLAPLTLGFLYCRFFITPLNWEQIKPLLLCTAVLTLSAAAVLLGAAFDMGYVHWDPKLPAGAAIWTLSNLFFVSVPEEVLFRGLLQEGLSPLGKWTAWVAASLLFGLYHWGWGWENLILTAVAGFFFGFAYLQTRRIEVPVLLHFIVNTVHFYLFSYPRLA